MGSRFSRSRRSLARFNSTMQVTRGSRTLFGQLNVRPSIPVRTAARVGWRHGEMTSPCIRLQLGTSVPATSGSRPFVLSVERKEMNQQLLKDAENWLASVKGREDPQTKLIRQLVEALTEVINPRKCDFCKLTHTPGFFHDEKRNIHGWEECRLHNLYVEARRATHTEDMGH